MLQPEIGKRVMGADTVKATVDVATGKTYDYEMRSITVSGAFSKAFAVRTFSDPEVPLGNCICKVSCLVTWLISLSALGVIHMSCCPYVWRLQSPQGRVLVVPV
jgi:hypothetical protein